MASGPSAMIAATMPATTSWLEKRGPVVVIGARRYGNTGGCGAVVGRNTVGYGNTADRIKVSH
jgi:hypothetical protein